MERQSLNNSSGSVYKTVKTVENVLLKVPLATGLYMEHVSAHTLEVDGRKIKIPPHWKNGLFIPSPKDRPDLEGFYINRIFYDLDHQDLGKFIVAKVEVIEKTIADGRKFVHLDIYKSPNSKPVFDLKFPTTCPKDKGEVLKTKHAFIHFKLRKKKSQAED